MNGNWYRPWLKAILLVVAGIGVMVSSACLGNSTKSCTAPASGSGTFTCTLTISPKATGGAAPGDGSLPNGSSVTSQLNGGPAGNFPLGATPPTTPVNATLVAVQTVGGTCVASQPVVLTSTSFRVDVPSGCPVGGSIIVKETLNPSGSGGGQVCQLLTPTFSGTRGPDSSNVCAAGFAVPPPGVALTVLKSASPSLATFGQPLTYTVTAQNGGFVPITAAQLSDPLPAGLSFQAVTTSQGSCSQASGTVTCQLGTLAAGGTATVQIMVTPLVTGTLTNTATVSGGGSPPMSGTVVTQVNPPGVGGAEPPVTGIPPLTIIGVPEVVNPNFPAVVTPPQQTAPQQTNPQQTTPAQQTTPLITVYPPNNNGQPGSQQLLPGCNQVTIGSAAGTAVSAIAARVNPPVVVAIYRFNNQLQRYQAGYFAMTGAPIDFSTTRGGIESYQICVSAPATISTG